MSQKIIHNTLDRYSLILDFLDPNNRSRLKRHQLTNITLLFISTLMSQLKVTLKLLTIVLSVIWLKRHRLANITLLFISTLMSLLEVTLKLFTIVLSVIWMSFMSFECIPNWFITRKSSRLVDLTLNGRRRISGEC